jgi:hypothetical protein
MVTPRSVNLLKSILHNIGVLMVGFAVGFAGRRIDSILGIVGFSSRYATAAGCLLLAAGFLLRVWATFYFYEQQLKVISLKVHQILITIGPLPLFAQSALSRRKRLHLFRSGPGARIASGAHHHRHPSAAGRCLHPA